MTPEEARALLLANINNREDVSAARLEGVSDAFPLGNVVTYTENGVRIGETLPIPAPDYPVWMDESKLRVLESGYEVIARQSTAGNVDVTMDTGTIVRLGWINPLTRNTIRQMGQSNMLFGSRGADLVDARGLENAGGELRNGNDAVFINQATANTVYDGGLGNDSVRLDALNVGESVNVVLSPTDIAVITDGGVNRFNNFNRIQRVQGTQIGTITNADLLQAYPTADNILEGRVVVESGHGLTFYPTRSTVNDRAVTP